MFALHAFAFVALLFLCSSKRTHNAHHSDHHVKQQHEAAHNASDAFGPLVGAHGQLEPQVHAANHNFPALAKISMQQEGPQIGRRDLLLLAGLSGVVAETWNLTLDAGVLTDEQKAALNVWSGTKDPMQDLSPLERRDVAALRNASARLNVMSDTKELTPSQRQEVNALTKAWMQQMRLSMSSMTDPTPSRCQEVLERANAQMVEISNKMTLVKDLTPQQRQDLVSDYGLDAMDRIQDLTPEQRQDLMNGNGLILRDGDAFAETYLEINTDQFMKQVLLDQEVMINKRSIAQNGDPFPALSETQLEINTERVMKEILLDVENSKHPSVPELKHNSSDRAILVALVPLTKDGRLNASRKLGAKTIEKAR